jgi:uncharacterized protein (DUF433 family)
MPYGRSNDYFEQPEMDTFSEHAGELTALTTWGHRHDDTYATITSRLHLWALRRSFEPYIYHELLRLAATRQLFLTWNQRDTDVRYYSISLVEAFNMAHKEYPSISVDPEVMAGAPCVAGTRIPVYMILDAIEHHGTVEGALESYPRLNIDQVRDAVGFAKLIVECPIGDEAATTS